MQFIVKTGDDDVRSPFADYLREKKKTVEFQFQGVFKTAPHGTVYFGVELPRMMELSRLTSSVAHGVVMAMSALNRNMGKMHFSVVTERDKKAPLENECSHVVYPLAQAVDTLIVTELDDWPKLGKDLPWRKEKVSAFDTEHVYTF